MSDTRPDFNPHPLITLIQESIQRCELQLENLTVLTKAAIFIDCLIRALVYSFPGTYT
jgi:hypothetical protein